MHISSHGKLDKDEKYFIAFENLDECGKSQKIEEYILGAQLRKVSSKLSDIDLVILSTCHSGGLAKLFLKYGAKKCIDFFTYKEFDREVREKFRKLKAKLSLFLYSIDDSEKIELNDFPKDVNYKLELQILKLLKK